jgi:hypothetical protein
MAPTATAESTQTDPTRDIKVELKTNEFNLDMSNKRLGWLAPTDPTLPIETLRDILTKQGKGHNQHHNATVIILKILHRLFVFERVTPSGQGIRAATQFL